MNLTTRYILLAGFFVISFVASGSVRNSERATGPSGLETYMSSIADMYTASLGTEVTADEQPAPAAAAVETAVPYFPAQYQLNAVAGSSEPLSTF